MLQLAAIPGSQERRAAETQAASGPGTAAIPGTRVPAPRPAQDGAPSPKRAAAAEAAHARSLARIPGVQAAAQPGAAAPQAPYRRHQPEAAVPAAYDAATKQAFISTVAPGAIAAQHKYGVPAAVTIAQAIEESGWGQSSLAAKDNNLFGIKGTGPAGSDDLPTQEYLNGQWVSQTAAFRVYHSVAQSIDDHGKLLAASGYYTRAMAARRSPNAFAAALTGVYATDPSYGATLIGLMRQYNLYRYDAGVASGPSLSAAPAARAAGSALAAEIPGAAWPGSAVSGGDGRAAAPAPAASNPHATTPATTRPSARQATVAPSAPDPSVSPATPRATATPVASDPTGTLAAPQITATPVAPRITVPPVTPKITATPTAPRITVPPVTPKVTATPAAPKVTATPTAPQATAPLPAAHATRSPSAAEGRTSTSAAQASTSPPAGRATASPTASPGATAPADSASGLAAIPGIARPAPAGRASGIPAQATTRADWIAGATAEMAGRAAHSPTGIELTAAQLPLSRPTARPAGSPAASKAAGSKSASPTPAASRPAISRAAEDRLADLQGGPVPPAIIRPASSPPASRPPASDRPGVSRAVEDRLADLQQPAGHQARSRSARPTRTTRAATTGTSPGQARGGTSGTARAQARVATARLYRPDIPPSVRNAFITTAKAPLIRDELLYRDVANQIGISWKLLAACDWMQCQARPGYSAVHGEKLGTVNADGTVYLTRSAGLRQCADDLLHLADSVYGIDLTARVCLSIADLANVFAAFRWGQLLTSHNTSAMEFPYSVAGLTAQHQHMRWPRIPDAPAPDKPGGRFRRPFGALPIVLGLRYPATA